MRISVVCNTIYVRKRPQVTAAAMCEGTVRSDPWTCTPPQARIQGSTPPPTSLWVRASLFAGQAGAKVGDTTVLCGVCSIALSRHDTIARDTTITKLKQARCAAVLVCYCMLRFLQSLARVYIYKRVIRVFLCREQWSISAARAVAMQVCSESEYDSVILCFTPASD